MKIVVLKGGISSEREVSLSSGKNISAALMERGHKVLSLDTVLPFEQLHREIPATRELLREGDKNIVRLLLNPEVQDADFVFNALHGGSGENGEIQGILQTMGFKYNGSGVEGCAIAMDKVVTKLLFERYRIPTPEWQHFNRVNELSKEEIKKSVLRSMPFPVVVKPSNEGSTVGVTIVEDEQELLPAIDKALYYNTEILVERYIRGRELTVGFLGDEALPVLEIVPKHGIYDYECKYRHGMSEYHVPANISDDLAKYIKYLSIVTVKALKCYGYGRLDLRLGDDEIPYFLEMNSLPGMTATSLVPKAAKAIGIDFSTLLEKIVKLGLNR
jgi:D-alanine-D-alanine ligase